MEPIVFFQRLVCTVLLVTAPMVMVTCQLDYMYYVRSCPNLARIVRYGVASALSNDTRMAASLLRLHFHDCIVNGCDGSLLLDDNDGIKSEKNALPNQNSARGFEVIDSIKANLEKACPSTVSCSDILALASRDAVYLAGGPFVPMPLGRRDGRSASIDGANRQIPSPFEPLDNLTAKFTSKGLSLKDVVVLSGAHTIGFAQCFLFKSRLFNFGGSGKPDPTLSESFLQSLQTQCPNQDSSDTNLAPLDGVTTTRFDNVYYRNLLNGSGLLGSDQALMTDNTTSSLVLYYSQYPYAFYRDFGVSLVKMANIGVLTGSDGEIRKSCRLLN
ncbi:PREDICTED: peroxidase 10-like [Tarenaya hassleriana]|uniref:peroxidase 10-like n=1 Tax=Tarenaya hassleriana TaxID=28532 RepID=UPI00053C399F|nr:PREDICTED: peroxidase 10-like [Tarenaya hassleriana]